MKTFIKFTINLILKNRALRKELASEKFINKELKNRIHFAEMRRQGAEAAAREARSEVSDIAESFIADQQEQIHRLLAREREQYPPAEISA